MSKTRDEFLLSRRGLIHALGAAAIAGVPGFAGGGTDDPRSPHPKSAAIITDGYADKQSYRPGDLVTLYLNAASPQSDTFLYLTDYAGRSVFTFPANVVPQTAVGPIPWETGFGYQASVSFTMPDLPSGVYLVEGIIPLIVKTAPSQYAQVVVLYPTNTVAAYNSAGGLSMYSQPQPATTVSFQRPSIRGNQLAFFESFLAWFAGLDLHYSLRYIADIDLEDYNEIREAKLLLVIGHSEYWTRVAREHFDQFVLSGGNALLLSGNNMWWQVRYSEDLSQMICYKRVPDPDADPLLQTINWPAPSLNYPVLPSIGGDFLHGGFDGDGFHVLSPNSPIFRGVAVKSGDLIWMPTTEYDGAPLLNSPVSSGEPRLDLSALGVYRAEIIGYARCDASDSAEGTTEVGDHVGTWIASQRTATSGVVINGASTNWCSDTGVDGEDAVRVRQIIRNMIEILANHESVFVA